MSTGNPLCDDHEPLAGSENVVTDNTFDRSMHIRRRILLQRVRRLLAVCTENPIRLDGAMESPKLAE
jgi:hypothetical protein